MVKYYWCQGKSYSPPGNPLSTCVLEANKYLDMVWFQCDACGENVKKPKLANHFRICPAVKLSCIDCGETFGQGNVQGHTHCISEAEKYGPKGHGVASKSAASRNNNDTKQKPDVDIKVGLSELPPWFCRLCNTKATSKQTLLLHGDGKKHRAKVRAFIASEQRSNKTEASSLHESGPVENNSSVELLKSERAGEQKINGTLKVDASHANKEIENEKCPSKRRKLFASSSNGIIKEKDGPPAKDAPPEKDAKQKMKLKKLIKSTLNSKPDRALKLQKLKKIVLESLERSGMTEDRTKLSCMIEQKINSSSRFKIADRYVFLVDKDSKL